MVPGGPFYAGGDFADFSTSTFPVAVPIPVTAPDDAFENALRQHHDDQLAVLGAAAPSANLYTTSAAAGQIGDINNSSSYQSDPSKDVIMISRQSWEHALSESSQAKRERDELRLQLATVRNELYTAKRVQKQLRMELDEVKVTAKTLRRQSTTLAETQKRLRKERNDARIRVAMLSKVLPRDQAAAVLKAAGGEGVTVINSNKSRDPLALLLGQAPAATPIADSSAARGGSMKAYDAATAVNNTSSNLPGGSDLLPPTQAHPGAMIAQQLQGGNNTQWHFDGTGGSGTLAGAIAMDESPENHIMLDPDEDDDQRLIDAFLAETSANSGGELSPEQAGFSPTTMAELFGGGMDNT
ncbi:hypothetical protein V8F06_004884 [Rhypophila decipiens]